MSISTRDGRKFEGRARGARDEGEDGEDSPLGKTRIERRASSIAFMLNNGVSREEIMWMLKIRETQFLEGLAIARRRIEDAMTSLACLDSAR